MAVDSVSFRVAYPAFADLIAYPPDTVTYWIGIAVGRLDPLRWAELYDEGVNLFVAHRLAMAKLSGATGLVGVVSSKSVGGVSVAYNTELGALEGGGNYNVTSFGRDFLMLARIVGMGGIQL